MPVVVKCTAFFGSDAGRGWSESHFTPGGSPGFDLLPYLDAFKSLNDNYRRPLLGSDCYLKGLRVSYPTDTGMIASSGFRYSPFSYPATKNEGAAPDSSAKVRFGEVTNTQFSDCHLRGFWDAVEHDEQLDFTTAKGMAWKNLLDQFTGALVAGNYGWLGMDSTTTRRGKISSYDTDADGFIVYQVSVDQGPPLPAAGALMEFRAAKLNNSKSVLNRTQIVQVIGAGSVATAVPTAAGDFTSAGTFVIRETSFLAYSGVQYTILGKRSMGRPTLQSATRLKDRPRA